MLSYCVLLIEVNLCLRLETRCSRLAQPLRDKCGALLPVSAQTEFQLCRRRGLRLHAATLWVRGRVLRRPCARCSQLLSRRALALAVERRGLEKPAAAKDECSRFDS